mgnify:CR=1 FL=1|jgi:predicted phage replisome organizer|tara:strand:+ start:254 stop:1036 length:783 start_codon:yes stop_codon:yes gene_type:complete
MAEIKWIKITVDIFDDEKIKLIDTLPDRDCTLVIWFKLLALTGKKNESGLLFMSPQMPYTDEMLATIFNRPINNVRLALKTFTDFGMIEIHKDNVINVVNWEKHQNIDGMDKIREQNRIRKQNQRLRQKQLQDKSHVTSRDDHATDKKKIRIEENKKKNNKDAVALCPLLQDSEVKKAWDEWIKVRDSKKASKSSQAITRAVNSLVKLSNNDKEVAIQVLNNSSDGGWTKLYELKPKFEQQSMFDGNSSVQINGGSYKIG